MLTTSSKPKKPNTKSKSLFDSIKENQAAQDYVRDIIKHRVTILEKQNSWRGMLAIPTGTLLESIVGEFASKTNISLEIPFFTLFHLVSGYLVHNDVEIKTDKGSCSPDFWTVILAESGAGKTYTHKTIRENLDPDLKSIEFPGTGVVSSAAFVEQLSKKPRGLWIRDEFLQLMRQINDGPMAQMKDYLLRIHDRDTIERQTKSGNVKAINPALTILGFNVTSTFMQEMSGDSLLDGLAQRFCYVIAKKDPQRPFLKYPMWIINGENWASQWSRMVKIIKPSYSISQEGMAGFFTAFNSLYFAELPESFYRRVLWRAHKYALVYHILNEKSSNVLDAQDYGWAARALSLHINDAASLLDELGAGELERKVKSAERLKERLTAKGKSITVRDLVSGVKAIKSAPEARFVMSLL